MTIGSLFSRKALNYMGSNCHFMGVNCNFIECKMSYFYIFTDEVVVLYLSSLIFGS